MNILLRIPVYLFCLIALNTCIDPYTPHMAGYKSILVAEGLVTDEKIPYEVTLSRTFQSIDSVRQKVTDAVVFITDESGSMTSLNYSGDGIYKTDSSLFTGAIGKMYTLHIKTSDGNKYESEPCIMTPVADIDSVYYAKEEKISSTSSETLKGLEIYLDSKEENGDNTYFRWEYEETWKFRMPSPKLYNYVNEKEIIPLPLTDVLEYCWKLNKSGQILTGSVFQGQSGLIQKEPVLFLQPYLSDRFTIRYSILVKQMSLSQKEYDFWNNLKKVNETMGTIFDTEPYSVISNIHNADNPNETVLGYFSVSAVKEKRIYIMPGDIKWMELPQFQYNCQEFAIAPSDWALNPVTGKQYTFDEIYDSFMAAGGIIFVRPVYTPQKTLLKLVFAPYECTDCSLKGSAEKPDFWTDMF
jgi:hypothetical protein